MVREKPFGSTVDRDGHMACYLGPCMNCQMPVVKNKVGQHWGTKSIHTSKLQDLKFKASMSQFARNSYNLDQY
ncbi:hypothetical protein MUK42_33071 [Musa troglodytarum]|uniref:Uncharacterized protein n=1 Tax=Musa troglodytarum TaxID=320322 RepID=A0A9E7FRT7_9LILI|nr:hypothetical protein MUK42_33071 [Musa troglodytarum]